MELHNVGFRGPQLELWNSITKSMELHNSSRIMELHNSFMKLTSIHKYILFLELLDFVYKLASFTHRFCIWHSINKFSWSQQMHLYICLFIYVFIYFLFIYWLIIYLLIDLFWFIDTIYPHLYDCVDVTFTCYDFNLFRLLLGHESVITGILEQNRFRCWSFGRNRCELT